MAATQQKYWVPDRTYEIQLKIGKRDLSMDLYEFSIISSVTLPYQTFFLELLLDSNDIILEEIYGQKHMNLTILLHATNTYPLDRIEFELMYLDSDFPMITKSQLSEQQHDKVPVSITAVPKNAYKTMNYYINDVFHGKKIEEVITSLVEKTGAKLSYDSSGRNVDVINQILVPPSSLYNNLRYLNKTFGIFNGAPTFFCDYENRVHIKNMSHKMNTAQAFTIYELATGVTNEKIIEKSNDGKTFYTVNPMETTYKGNSVFAALAPKMIHLIKPLNKLTQQININTEQFTKSYGLISKSNEIFFDKSSLINRVAIHKDHTGYESSETFLNGNLSLKISDITELIVNLQKSLKLLNLMNVGESVQVTSQHTNSTDMSGRYILKGSEISFHKIKDWETDCKLILMRTNRSLT